MARPAYLELSYKRFNPRGSSFMPYYLVRQDYDFCNGLGSAEVIATSATSSPQLAPPSLRVWAERRNQVEKVLARQHLYLQVAGQPQNRNPDFATGQGQGILEYRPSTFVPVQVPLYDEEASEIARQAYRQADRESPGLNLKAPEPLYAWRYRPELQFSLYERNVEAIRKTDAEERISDILRGEKERGLAIGEQEIKATLGADQTIRFDNFEHLGALDVDDFLTMHLYANNGVDNTLMEWAFEYLSVFANEDVEMGDKGYGVRGAPRLLRPYRCQSVIARCERQRKRRPGLPRLFEHPRYRQRNSIECLSRWLKEKRRLCTRFDKLANSVKAIATMACVDRRWRVDFSGKPWESTAGGKRFGVQSHATTKHVSGSRYSDP